MSLNVVIDLSHFNHVTDFGAAKDDGIVGVIHKATEGDGYTDPMYETHKKQALAAGLWWGAYHFGTGGDPVAQAQHFLKFVSPGPNDLLALDLEKNTGGGGNMSLEEAEKFVSHVESATGRWPGLYSGSYIKEILGDNHNATLGKCWFWLSEYGPVARVPANWPKWTMWQYTDGAVGPGPHSVNGVGNCDRDKYNGDKDELSALWGHQI